MREIGKHEKVVPSGRPKGSVHKPVWLTSRQAYKLYLFLEDFSSEFFKYTGSQSTTILVALRTMIPDRLFEEGE